MPLSDPDLEAAYSGTQTGTANPTPVISDPDLSAIYGGETSRTSPLELDPTHMAIIRGTSLNPIVNKALGLPKQWGDELQAYVRSKGIENPYIQAAIGELPQLGANVAATLVGGTRAIGEAAALPSFAEEEAAETGRLADIHARANAKGFDIPAQGSQATLTKAAANNQPLADNVVRGNFGLSGDAPLTPQMLDSWRSKFAVNSTYAEARAVPKVQLNDDAVENLSNLPDGIYRRLGIDSKVSNANTISGDDAVDVSQALRARASRLWKSSKMFPEYEDQAASMDRTVDTLEDSVGNNLKDPDQWNLDRAKIAQSYDVQSALDSGHVDVRDLARLKFAKGQIKPWSGDLSDLADLGQLHPESFQLTRTPVPQYGLLRRGAAAAARYGLPLAGTAIGGYVAQKIGHSAGEAAANAITPP